MYYLAEILLSQKSPHTPIWQETLYRIAKAKSKNDAYDKCKHYLDTVYITPSKEMKTVYKIQINDTIE